MSELKERVAELETRYQCNCDLDNWEPERDTGHSTVCGIHRLAKGLDVNYPYYVIPKKGVPHGKA